MFVTTELRGGGTATAASSRVAKVGVRNLLIHAGILRGTIETQPTRWLDMPSAECFGFAEEDGLVEPLKDLGEFAKRGEVLVRIHPIGRTGQAPFEHRARIDGDARRPAFPRPRQGRRLSHRHGRPGPLNPDERRMLMRRAVKFGLAASLLLLGLASASATTLEQVKKQGFVRGANANEKPYAFMDADGNAKRHRPGGRGRGLEDAGGQGHHLVGDAVRHSDPRPQGTAL